MSSFNLTRWRDAAVLMSIPLALAAQRIRFESYETEKTGLLLILAAVIFGLAFHAKLSIPRHPIVFIVGTLVVWALVSTAFALTPGISLWGAPYRGQGWLMLVAGFILMWGASQLSDSARGFIRPLLCLTAIPMCLLAWVSRLGLDPALPHLVRPASLAGNANFLENWLVMVFILIAPLVFGGGRLRILGVTTGILILATLIMTEGRAALLSLLGAGFFAGMVWGVVYQKRGILFLVLVGSLIAGGLYVVGGQVGIRLFTLDDPARTAMWGDGIKLIGEMSIPFVDAHDMPDSWAGLRPLVGYGSDNLEQTHPRLVESPYYFSSWIDRFHNLALDTILILGWPGLILQVGVYLAALFTGLGMLGLISTRGAKFGLLGGMGVGSLVGLAAGAVVGFAPAGAGLGGAVGVMGWLMWRVLREPSPPPPLPQGEGSKTSLARILGLARNPLMASGDKTEAKLNSEILVFISLLTVVVQQWIANQFGFMQTLGQIVWWVALGLLVGGSRVNKFTPPPIPLPVNGEGEQNQPSPMHYIANPVRKGREQPSPVENMQMIGCVPALMLIHSLGAFPLGLAYASLTTLIMLAAVAVLISWWVFGMDKWSVGVVVVCGVVIAGLRGLSAGLLNLGGFGMVVGAGVLALSGLVVVGVGVYLLGHGLFTPPPAPPRTHGGESIPRRFRLKDDFASEGQSNQGRVRLWGSAVCIIGIGIFLYVVPYVGAALHRIGDTLAAQGNYSGALESLDFALLYSPVDSRVYLSRVHVQLSSSSSTRLEAARFELKRLFDDAPFMANTRDIYDLRRVLGE